MSPGFILVSSEAQWPQQMSKQIHKFERKYTNAGNNYPCKSVFHCSITIKKTLYFLYNLYHNSAKSKEIKKFLIWVLIFIFVQFDSPTNSNVSKINPTGCNVSVTLRKHMKLSDMVHFPVCIDFNIFLLPSPCSSPLAGCLCGRCVSVVYPPSYMSDNIMCFNHDKIPLRQ